MCVSGGAVGSVRSQENINRDVAMIARAVDSQQERLRVLEERVGLAEWRVFCLAMLIVGLTGGIIVGQLT